MVFARAPPAAAPSKIAPTSRAIAHARAFSGKASVARMERQRHPGPLLPHFAPLNAGDLLASGNVAELWRRNTAASMPASSPLIRARADPLSPTRVHDEDMRRPQTSSTMAPRRRNSLPPAKAFAPRS